jgi:hypothetical protein
MIEVQAADRTKHLAAYSVSSRTGREDEYTKGSPWHKVKN